MENIKKYIEVRKNKISKDITTMEEKMEDELFAVNQPNEYIETELKLYNEEGKLKSLMYVEKLLKEEPFVGLFYDALFEKMNNRSDEILDKVSKLEASADEYEEDDEDNEFERQNRLLLGELSENGKLESYLKENL